MKKLLILLGIMVFAFTTVAAMAQEKQQKAKKTEKKVSCCIKGECKDMTKAECAEEKGKVVADCSKCKPAKASKSVKPALKSMPKPKPEPKLPESE